MSSKVEKRDKVYEPKRKFCKECGKPYLRWVGYAWGEFCGYNCRCKYEKEHPKKRIHTMKGRG